MEILFPRRSVSPRALAASRLTTPARTSPHPRGRRHTQQGRPTPSCPELTAARAPQGVHGLDARPSSGAGEVGQKALTPAVLPAGPARGPADPSTAPLPERAGPASRSSRPSRWLGYSWVRAAQAERMSAVGKGERPGAVGRVRRTRSPRSMSCPGVRARGAQFLVRDVRT